MSSQFQRVHLTPILSKVFERLVSVRLLRFMECRGVLPTTHVAYRKSLVTCDSLLCVAHTLHSALELGQEARMVQIDFSAAFDRDHHKVILFKLCSVGVGGSVCFCFCFVFVKFSEQMWLFNGQIDDSTAGDFFSPT